MVDLDAALVTAHSQKEQTAPILKRGFGFHLPYAFADHHADAHRRSRWRSTCGGKRSLGRSSVTCLF